MGKMGFFNAYIVKCRQVVPKVSYRYSRFSIEGNGLILRLFPCARRSSYRLELGIDRRAK